MASCHHYQQRPTSVLSSEEEELRLALEGRGEIGRAALLWWGGVGARGLPVLAGAAEQCWGAAGPPLKNAYAGSFTSNTSSFGPQRGAKQGAYTRVKGYKGKGEMEDVARASRRASEACQKR